MAVPGSAGAAGGQSFLAMPVTNSNFLSTSSANIATGATSGSVTFTMPPGTTRITAKITNKGTKGAYLAYGAGSATAVASTTTPGPNCDYIGAGAILQQDFPPGTDTFAVIEETSTTTLEISVGYGQ